MTRKEENEIYNEGLEFAKKAIYFVKIPIETEKNLICYLAAEKYLLNYNKYDESRGSKYTFMYTIINNLLNDEKRLILKRNEINLFNISDKVYKEENIIQEIDYKILKKKIQAILNQNFKPEYKNLFDQYFFDGNYGIDLSTQKSKSLIHRAKKIIKENLYKKKEIAKVIEIPLTKQQRIIYDKHFIQGIKQKDIAAEMNCTYNNINLIVNKIKHKLK